MEAENGDEETCEQNENANVFTFRAGIWTHLWYKGYNPPVLGYLWNNRPCTTI